MTDEESKSKFHSRGRAKMIPAPQCPLGHRVALIVETTRDLQVDHDCGYNRISQPPDQKHDWFVLDNSSDKYTVWGHWDYVTRVVLVRNLEAEFLYRTLATSEAKRLLDAIDSLHRLFSDPALGTTCLTCDRAFGANKPLPASFLVRTVWRREEGLDEKVANGICAQCAAKTDEDLLNVAHFLWPGADVSVLPPHPGYKSNRRGPSARTLLKRVLKDS